MTANELGQLLAGANVFFTVVSLFASTLAIGVFLREIVIERKRHHTAAKSLSDQLSVFDE